jgi:hypothetical protein
VAVKANEMALVRYFVEDMKCDINESREREDEGQEEETLGSAGVYTGLAIAISKGFDAIARYLIEKGAKVTAEMFQSTCMRSNVDMVKLLFQNLPV